MLLRARVFVLAASLGLIAGGAVAACSAGGKNSAAGGEGGKNSAAGGDGGSGAGGGPGSGGMTGSTHASSATGIDVASATTGSGGNNPGDAACVATGSEAKSTIQPADIIIAVDTSGSMSQEKGFVQQNLNNFASIITASGIDVHVVMIADNSMTIGPPLGSGGMPDDNLPIYRHVQQGVDSHDALDLFISTYPMWKASLRPNASKTFLVVSDDDASSSAQTFDSGILALDPPTFKGYKFDAIFSYQDPVTCEAQCLGMGCQNCPKCCTLCNPISAAEGKVYEALVAMTMGVKGDLCDQNFGPVFMDMATAVVKGSSIACEYPIPKPDGGMLDPTQVNVSYTPGGQMKGQTILNVPGGLKDCGPAGGWYYDDPVNPTKVEMCPATCMALQSDPMGKVEILFGCATEQQPPK